MKLIGPQMGCQFFKNVDFFFFFDNGPLNSINHLESFMDINVVINIIYILTLEENRYD